MSIGALSKATGVPTETLRTWERRYGFPAPERTETGHRRYSLNTLARLRLVVRALGLGHRPSTVLAAGEEELAQLLAAAAPEGGPAAETARAAHDTTAVVQSWLEHVERFEGRALERELHVAASALGGVPFLEYAVAPFLRELGERWACGALGVAHEHFASERLREFLTQRWRPLSDASTGPLLVCATRRANCTCWGCTWLRSRSRSATRAWSFSAPTCPRPRSCAPRISTAPRR